jgi:DNA-binding MarR family transcriptional regulator
VRPGGGRKHVDPDVAPLYPVSRVLGEPLGLYDVGDLMTNGDGCARPPAESGPCWLARVEQDAWNALAGLLLLLPGVLDAQLQCDAGLNMFDYLVLSALSMAQDRTLRMSELAQLANGSLSRLSNVASRLERRGWLLRYPDPADGRYTNATLTEGGWDLVVRAAPGHVAAVRHYVIDPLTAAEARTLCDAAERILCQVRGD